MTYHLAQFNIARAKGPTDGLTDGDVMAEFMANLDPINKLADDSPGFVWRHQDADGNSTSVRAFDDPDILLNLSVWESVDTLRAYVYKSDHVAFVRRRVEWFEPVDDLPVMVMWWIPAGTTPTIEESVERLRHLAEHGPSPEGFTFRHRFDPPTDDQ